MEKTQLTQYDIYNDKVLNEISALLLAAYKANLDSFNALATTNLRNTATYSLKYDDLAGKIILNFELADYYKYLEYGSKPHFPPIGKIEEWIKIKNIKPVPGKNGRIPSTKQLAFAICKTMERGKTDIDGKQTAYISRPALRYMLDDNKDLIAKFVDRIGELFNQDISGITSGI